METNLYRQSQGIEVIRVVQFFSHFIEIAHGLVLNIQSQYCNVNSMSKSYNITYIQSSPLTRHRKGNEKSCRGSGGRASSCRVSGRVFDKKE